MNHSKNTILKIAGISLAVLSVVLSLIVIAIWFIDSPVLANLNSTFILMKFNTSICMLFIATALIILHSNNKNKIIVNVVLSITLIIAAISIAEDITDIDLGIDQLFVVDDWGTTNKEQHPGRQSTIASMGFILCCAGIWLAGRTHRKLKKLSQFALGITIIFCFVTTIGYLFNSPSLTQLNFVTPITLPATLGLLCVAVSGVFLTPSVGYLAIFTGSKIGNIMARKLLFQIIAATVIIGYLRLMAHNYNLFSYELALSLTILILIMVFSILISAIAVQLNSIEDSRDYTDKKFWKLLDSTPNGIVIANSDGKIEMVNKQCEELFGYTKDEIIGHSLDTLLPHKHIAAQQLQKEEEAKTDAAQQKKATSNDVIVVHKNGSEVAVEVGLNTLDVSNDKIVIASVINITERKKNEAIIKGQVTELQFRNKELEQFNYIASHDLQEPLRTVSNYIQVIEEDYYDKLDNEVKDYLNTISSATTRMSMLVRSLLDFSRLGRNKTLKKVDCNIMVKNVVADLNKLITNTNGIIIINELPVINAYETELRQVFQNLINNALKFAKKDTRPEVIIGCEQNEKNHEFYITDNGIGINYKHYERIFNIFQKLHHETEYEGHGIGLSNCRKIAEIHDGRIWVESELGSGSTFKFTISNFLT